MGVYYSAILFVGREFEDQYDAQHFFEKYFNISEEDKMYIEENGFIDYCYGLENGLRGEMLNYYSGYGFVLGINIGELVRQPENFSEEVQKAISKWKELFWGREIRYYPHCKSFLNKGEFMLDEMYKAVKDFNTVAGSTNTDYKSFKNQVALIYEEGVKEAEEALRDGSVVKMLDSVVDALYVVMGNLQRLELMGCDIQGAIKQVCDDNAKKFPKQEKVAQSSVLHYNSQNINVNYTYNPEYDCYVIKDENKKIRKPVGFVGTDLTKYVPEGVLKGGIV